MTDYYPLLQPADWPDRDQTHYWHLGPAEWATPIVVVAADLGDSYGIVEFDESTDAPALWEIISTNLRALQYEWEPARLDGLPLLTCSGYDFSAEKILDPGTLHAAHIGLDTDRLLIAAPRRRCLYAAPYNLSTEQAGMFAHIVRYTYNDDSYGNAPITPGLFVVEETRVVEFIQEVESFTGAGLRRPY